MILDVGCGEHPHGDVNLDLGKRILASDSGPYGKANIYASVYNLPFIDNSFEVVHFVGLLHHLDNPVKAWNEIVRVAKDIIVGEEPSKFNIRAYLDKYHVYHGFWKRQLRKDLPAQYSRCESALLFQQPVQNQPACHSDKAVLATLDISKARPAVIPYVIFSET